MRTITGSLARGSRAMLLLFAIGAVSGTTLSFELGLLWPEFMKHAGAVVGVPFSAEGFAFFIEAIFVGIYLYGWDRLSPLQHWLCSIPIVVTGALSAAFVTAVNAWMNTPAGFTNKNGVAVDIHPLQAILNPAMPTEVVHTTLSAYVFSGFAVATIYALTLLREPANRYAAAALRVGCWWAAWRFRCNWSQAISPRVSTRITNPSNSRQWKANSAPKRARRCRSADFPMRRHTRRASP